MKRYNYNKLLAKNLCFENCTRLNYIFQDFRLTVTYTSLLVRSHSLHVSTLKFIIIFNTQK
jgi:hypothetical protein